MIDEPLKELADRTFGDARKRKTKRVAVPRFATIVKGWIGKRVEWEYNHDHKWGTCSVGTGTVTDVQGRNIWIDGTPRWIPDLRNLKLLP